MLLRYAEKTGLQNVMQGSYKFQFRSPAGSHLSKLVATPGFLGVQSKAGYCREVRLNFSFVAKNYLYFFPERCDHKK